MACSGTPHDRGRGLHQPGDGPLCPAALLDHLVFRITAVDQSAGYSMGAIVADPLRRRPSPAVRSLRARRHRWPARVGPSVESRVDRYRALRCRRARRSATGRPVPFAGSWSDVATTWTPLRDPARPRARGSRPVGGDPRAETVRGCGRQARRTAGRARRADPERGGADRSRRSPATAVTKPEFTAAIVEFLGVRCDFRTSHTPPNPSPVTRRVGRRAWRGRRIGRRPRGSP